jgi:Secretion system C-terminal sorting domain
MTINLKTVITTIMKKALLSFLLIASLQAIAQNANWGTGLPVSGNINVTSVDLSVFDTILNQTSTINLSVGSNPNYVNSDGVVVAYGSDGNMSYATYDVELHTWKAGSTQISSGSTTGIIFNSNGAVVGYGTNGDMEYATYDVELHSWKTGSTQISSSNSPGTIVSSDGVVVGYGTQGNMEYATYDAELHTWKTGSTQISSSNSPGTIVTSDGVVVGYGTQGNMEYATYDVELQTWKTGSTQISSSNSSGTINTSDGVVVGYGTQGDMEYAIYDFNLDAWRTGSQQLGSSGSVYLNSGTINYTGSSSAGILGYDPNTQNWGNFYTTPTCIFLPVVSSSSSWVFMRCMSIGAGTYLYSSGDGHQISRRQGWKKYNSSNSYNANLNISNGIYSSSCNATIQIVIGIEEYSSMDFQIFPNPATDWVLIDCAERTELKMQVYNIIGECTLQNDLTAGKNILDISSLISGIYLIRLTGAEGTYQQKLIKK